MCGIIHINFRVQLPKIFEQRGHALRQKSRQSKQKIWHIFEKEVVGGKISRAIDPHQVN